MSQTQNSIKNIVDENQTRIHAGLVFLLMGAYLFSGELMIIYFLIYDFLVRIYLTSMLSPLYLLSEGLVNLIGLKKKFTDESAKEFASHVGLTLLFSALFAELLEQSYIAFTLIAILSLWKIFEATKDICFACKLYELLKNKNIRLESL